MDEGLSAFVTLAKGSQGGTLLALLKQATANPHTYVFGELLDVPAVAKLAQGTDAEQAAHELLTIFAYGTWSDYAKGKERFGPLKPEQERKLKQLTLTTLAAQHPELPYSMLSEAVDMSNVRELEDLILDTIYEGLIEAKIDQRAKLVKVDFAQGRDLRPGQLEHMLAVLQAWSSKAQRVLKTIEDRVGYARGEWKMKEMHQEAHEARVKDVKASIKAAMEAALDDGDGRGRRGPRRGMGAMGGGGGRIGGLFRGFLNQ